MVTPIRTRTLAGAAILLLASCLGDSTGLGTRRARLLIDAAIDHPWLQLTDVNRVLVRFNRPLGGPKVFERAVNFPASSDEIDLTVVVPLASSSEQLELTLILIAMPSGDTVFRAGPSLVTVSAGASNVPVQAPPFLYTGVGASAVGVRFVTTPTQVAFGDTVTFTAEAFGADDEAIPGTPILFSSDVALRASVPDRSLGRVVGGTQRGSVPIIARLLRTSADPEIDPPSATASLSVLATPNALVLQGGGGQIGPAGAPLALPVTVRVNAVDGLGVPDVTVAFAVTLGGGSLSETSVVTDADGDVAVTWTLGATPGAQGISATVAGLAGGSIGIGATASGGGGGVRTWTGATSTDWQIAGNWSPAGVPAVTDNVVIPAGMPHDPQLTADATINDLTIESCATLNVATFGLILFGNAQNDGEITADGGGVLLFSSQGAQPSLVRGIFPGLSVLRNMQLTGDLTVNGDLAIAGDPATMVLGGWSAYVAGDLILASSGKLVMSDVEDVFTVEGSATFAGASLVGSFLTAGVLNVGGDFAQLSLSSPSSFVSTGTRLRFFGPSNHAITIQSPAQSTLHDLQLTGAGGLFVDSDVTATGQLIASLDGGFIQSGGGERTLRVSGLNVADVLFQGVRLRSVDGNIDRFDFVTFMGLEATDTSLVISHPGVGSPYDFYGIVWEHTPTGAGRYLHVIDNLLGDGQTLTINLENTTPADGSEYTSTEGDATVNWTVPPPPPRHWTGAADTDWNHGGNWEPFGVPAADESVVIDAVAVQPTLTSDVEVVAVLIVGNGARLTIGGHQLTTGTLTVHTDGLLQMTDPNDRVVVSGDAWFQGGNQTGLLTAGELHIAGGFSQQQQTDARSFFASGTHRTVMTGTNLQSVRFCCTAAASGFQNLDISGSVGINIQNVGNGVFVFDTLISQPGAGPAPMIYMLGSPMTARRLRVDGLVVDRGNLILNENGVAADQQFDNVTFQNYLSTQTRFSVVAPGGAAGPRTLTFNNLSFLQPLAVGNTGRYLTVSAPTGTLIVNLPGATSVSNGPSFTTITGAATVNWPP